MGVMHRSHPPDPVLITTARQSGDDEFDRRRKKYAVMMTVRALCVVGAAATYHLSMILALAFVVGGVALPWCAVIIANDGPAKRRAKSTGWRHDLRTERALPSADESRTVDG
jgi:Flp pilus assembly protein TadB